MRYVISDIHGEYALFLRLMDKINFSADDELYVCGDVIEKGPDSVKLLRHLLEKPNVHMILGNHEDGFLKYHHHLMENADENYDEILSELKKYIQGDGELLDWDILDKIEALPYYIEKDDFICVHAGIPLDNNGKLMPLSSVNAEELLYSRRFKAPELVPKDSKCVFFGHTATTAISVEPKILAYKNPSSNHGDIRDLYKVHLDTGTCISGILGCFCIDDCRAYYVNRRD